MLSLLHFHTLFNYYQTLIDHMGRYVSESKTDEWKSHPAAECVTIRVDLATVASEDKQSNHVFLYLQCARCASSEIRLIGTMAVFLCFVLPLLQPPTTEDEQSKYCLATVKKFLIDWIWPLKCNKNTCTKVSANHINKEDQTNIDTAIVNPQHFTWTIIESQPHPVNSDSICKFRVCSWRCVFNELTQASNFYLSLWS